MSVKSEESNLNKNKFLCGVCEGFYGKPWTVEQRKELFRRMQRFGMNTYLYAPKDDYKHRLYWRELYTQDETDELKTLIESARECNISFVYALSPGLDIVYSNHDDVTVLKMKLDQVKNLGSCQFALLFDDIEDELSSEDCNSYLSIAHAQCSLSNDMYYYLGQPELFLFCPTEYCTSRTVPDMSKSAYLQTIGNKLDPKIDFLWTGPRVVSRQITVDSIAEVSDIVKRSVTIWDNLHANDYDQTRLYLGPYDGRPTELVQHLRGVLTNPNCEFEANFIAMHTLAQWSRNGVRRFPDSSRHDVAMETEDVIANEDEKSTMTAAHYCPKQALVTAVTDWLPELYKKKRPFGQPKGTSSSSVERRGPNDEDRPSNQDQNPSNTTYDNDNDDDDATATRKTNEKSNSDVDAVARKRFDPLTVADVILLCDLFYLPYEHGPQAVQLLTSARWLVANFHLLVDRPGVRRLMSKGRIEWYDRAIQFHECYTNLSVVVDRFVNIPNRELLYELYSYVSDMRSNLALVNSYIKWHGIDKPEKEPFKSGEQEPWVHRGGILAEFRRLLPIEYAVGDFQSTKPVDMFSRSFVIRPYFSADKNDVYSVCTKTFDDRMDASDAFVAFPELAGDINVGVFLKFFPEFCWVVEDENGVCGYAVSAPNACDYHSRMTKEWLTDVRQKYPRMEDVKNADGGGSPDGAMRPLLTAEGVIAWLHANFVAAPDDVCGKYPSFIHVSVIPGRTTNHSVTNALLQSAIKSLANAGSNGLHTVIPLDNHAELEFYYGVGFTDVTDSGNEIESCIFLAKTFAG